MAIEGTDVQLTCGASIYKYSQIQWVMREEDGPDLSQVEDNTEIDLRSVLTVRKVQLSDAGHYECIGTLTDPGETTAEQRTVMLQVTPSETPQPRGDNTMVNHTEVCK